MMVEVTSDETYRDKRYLLHSNLVSLNLNLKAPVFNWGFFFGVELNKFILNRFLVYFEELS